MTDQITRMTGQITRMTGHFTRMTGHFTRQQILRNKDEDQKRDKQSHSTRAGFTSSFI